MTLPLLMLTCFGFSVIAGAFGAVLGIGGGIIIIPLLTLLLHVDIHLAIGASITAVVASSCAGAATYLRQNLANLRVGIFLEVSTVCGAFAGAIGAGAVSGRWLFAVFGLLQLGAAIFMLYGRRLRPVAQTGKEELADRLGLHGSAPVDYRVTHVRSGFGLSFLAGALSGLLGVGGGIVKVPVMNLVMGMPLKAATATSNLMIGVTAATGAGAYFARGEIQPYIAGPVAAGVLVGASLGSRGLRHLGSGLLRHVFVVVLVISSVQMLMRSAA